MLHCDACCTHPQVCKYCIDSTDSFLMVFLLLNVIMWTYPLGNPMLVELVGGMALWPELGENVPDNFQSTTLLSEKMLTSNIHREWLLDSCSLAFPMVSAEFQQSHSFSLFKCKVKMLVSFPNAVLPLTGSFIFPQATYKETRRVKGCLLTRHFTPVCHHRPLLYIYMWSDCIIWDWPRLSLS